MNWIEYEMNWNFHNELTRSRLPFKKLSRMFWKTLRNFPEWLPPNVNMKDWGKTDVSSGYLQLGKFSACKISFRLFKGLYWLCCSKETSFI